MITKSDFINYSQCGERYFLDQSLGVEREETSFTLWGELVGLVAKSGVYDSVFELKSAAENHKLADVVERAREIRSAGRVNAQVACKVGAGFTWDAAVEKTLQLMGDETVSIIYEAAFIHGEYACLVDILERADDGWSAYEVKSFLATNAFRKLSSPGNWLDDITFQHLVVSHTIQNIRFNLMCLNPRFRLGGEEELFVTRLVAGEKVPKRILPYLDDKVFNLDRAIGDTLEKVLNRLQQLNKGKRQLCSTIGTCKRCCHLSECRGENWGGHFWRGKSAKCALDDITEEYIRAGKSVLGPVARTQLRILRARQEDGLVIDAPGILPANPADKFLDFESLLQPLPEFEGSGPWEQIPFMFAVGDLSDGTTAVVAPPERHPGQFLIDQLCKMECGGRLFHWGAYDRNMVEKLIDFASDEGQKAELTRLLGKMQDLCKITQDSAYHPDFDFSFSIKSVGPYFSGVDYSECEVDALTAGYSWLRGKQDGAIKYCKMDVEQMVAVATGVLGSCEFGDCVPDQLLSMIPVACEDVNRNCRAVPHPEDLEMKLKSSIVHDWFMGALERLGCTKGAKSSKPDLYLPLDETYYLIEIKASAKEDWQTHTTDGQAPLPPGHIHVLLSLDPDGFQIVGVYTLLDAEWELGSSRNGVYARLTPDSKARRVLVWEQSRSPTLPNPVDES